jgi:hypothetical protein
MNGESTTSKVLNIVKNSKWVSAEDVVNKCDCSPTYARSLLSKFVLEESRYVDEYGNPPVLLVSGKTVSETSGYFINLYQWNPCYGKGKPK